MQNGRNWFLWNNMFGGLGLGLIIFGTFSRFYFVHSITNQCRPFGTLTTANNERLYLHSYSGRRVPDALPSRQVGVHMLLRLGFYYLHPFPSVNGRENAKHGVRMVWTMLERWLPETLTCHFVVSNLGCRNAKHSCRKCSNGDETVTARTVDLPLCSIKLSWQSWLASTFIAAINPSNPCDVDEIVRLLF